MIDGLTAHLLIDGDGFKVRCPHASSEAVRTHDPTIPEDDEHMVRYALQRHPCQKSCTLPLWNDWFEKRRQRFLAAGHARAHG